MHVIAVRAKRPGTARERRCAPHNDEMVTILACHEVGITVTLPKPQTSGAKSDGRFAAC